MTARGLGLRCKTCGTRPVTVDEILELDDAGRCPDCRHAWGLFVRVTGMLLVLGVALALFAWIIL